MYMRSLLPHCGHCLTKQWLNTGWAHLRGRVREGCTNYQYHLDNKAKDSRSSGRGLPYLIWEYFSDHLTFCLNQIEEIYVREVNGYQLLPYQRRTGFYGLVNQVQNIGKFLDFKTLIYTVCSEKTRLCFGTQPVLSIQMSKNPSTWFHFDLLWVPHPNHSFRKLLKLCLFIGRNLLLKQPYSKL